MRRPITMLRRAMLIGWNSGWEAHRAYSRFKPDATAAWCNLSYRHITHEAHRHQGPGGVWLQCPGRKTVY